MCVVINAPPWCLRCLSNLIVQVVSYLPYGPMQAFDIGGSCVLITDILQIEQCYGKHAHSMVLTLLLSPQ